MTGYDGDNTDFCSAPLRDTPNITKEESETQNFLVWGTHEHFELCRVFVQCHVGSYHRAIIVRLKEGVNLRDVEAALAPDGKITLSDENWINGIR